MDYTNSLAITMISSQLWRLQLPSLKLRRHVYDKLAADSVRCCKTVSCCWHANWGSFWIQYLYVSLSTRGRQVARLRRLGATKIRGWDNGYSTNYCNHGQRHHFESGVQNNAARALNEEKTFCLFPFVTFLRDISRKWSQQKIIK